MTIRVALVQLSNGPDRAANIERALAIMETAAAEGARLICFPEISFDLFFPQDRAEKAHFKKAEPIPGPTTATFQAAARRTGMVTVINLFERCQPGEYYDSCPVIDADGSLLGVTRMTHICEDPLFNEKFYYRPGNTGWPVYDTAVGRIGVSICYDRHFPESHRALTVAGARLVLCPTVCCHDEPFEMYEVELQAASFDNQIYTALINKTGTEAAMSFPGRSVVVDPWGRVIARGDQRLDSVVYADVDFELVEEVRQQRYYLRDRRPSMYRPLSDA